MTDAPFLTKPKASRRRRVVDKAMRQRIETAIEAMINALDMLDAPAEDIEPSLGSIDSFPDIGGQYFGDGVYRSSGLDQTNCGACGTTDDREEEHDGSEPDVDDEPSLGATEHINQNAAWHVTFNQAWNPDAEPSLGSIEGIGPNFPYCSDGVLTSHGLDQTQWSRGTTDDREEEHDGSEPDVDDEPSLGASEHFNQNLSWRAVTPGDIVDGEPSLGSLECINQTRWANGRNDDREQEHDGREPDPDFEPSLGSSDQAINQTLWHVGCTDDREQDDAEQFERDDADLPS